MKEEEQDIKDSKAIEEKAIFGTLPEEEKKRLREFPIWRYWRTAME